MNRALAILGFAGLTLASSIAAAADSYAFHRSFDATIEAPGANTLTIRGFNGDVLLTADSNTSVRIHALLRARSQETLDGTSVRAQRTGNEIRIEDVCASQRRILFWSFSDCDIEYQILYPRSLTVHVQHENGDVRVLDAGAPVSVAISNGDVAAPDAVADLDLATKHGDVKASLKKDWKGSSITLRTSTGDVDLKVPPRFNGTLAARTRLGTVTDDAHLSSGAVKVIATTTLGDVSVTRASPP